MGQIQSKGVIHVPQTSYDECLKARDRVNSIWRLDGYKTGARCIYIKYYSEHNGAYNAETK
jgi:autonomous glycyl radical cofactor GrcA